MKAEEKNTELVVSAFHDALERTPIEKTRVCMVSDIPFPPSLIRPLGVDFFHTTRGRAIPFATGMKLGNPKLKVVVFIGDLVTLGGNHFVHAGRRNMDILIICVNDSIYTRIAGEELPVKLERIRFSSYGSFEEPFNIPHLANSCGAVYIARWTALHKEELSGSISYALQKNGFSLIDVLSQKSDILEFYHTNSEVREEEDTNNVAITEDKKIIVGKFIDRQRPTFIDSYNKQLSRVMGDKFVKIEV